MANEVQPSNLPADIAAAVTSVVHALIPSSLKALNRLVGASVEIPAAYLDRVAQRAKAKTNSYVAVEDAVAKAVALGVATDEELARRAMTNLVAKEYRKQENREAIARGFLSELQNDQSQTDAAVEQPPDVDDDWLNVFERFAEDATSDRMQKLWARVLAGEVRSPGRFSMRTLRFLSEFSQSDALLFEDLCNSAFAGLAPKGLIHQNDEKGDITQLLKLEAAGLISGVSGGGVTHTRAFNTSGYCFVVEGNIGLQMKGAPGATLTCECYLLTPLGSELIDLIPARDQLAVARKFALSIRSDIIAEAMMIKVGVDGMSDPFEALWQASPAV